MNYVHSGSENFNEVIAELNVTGSALDPDALTRRTQLLPTKKWLVGETIGRSSRHYEHNGWSIATPKRSEIGEAVEDLLSTLTAHWNELLEAIRGQEVELSIVVHARSFIPAIHIETAQLAQIAELNASIDIDLYDHREEASVPLNPLAIE
jgi:hypothetical protein